MSDFSTLSKGDKAKILAIMEGPDAYRKQLLAMGLTPNTQFTVSRVAPLGDPMQIQVRGFFLSLRKKEAKLLKIKKVD